MKNFWSNNRIQFSRLLAEIGMMGLEICVTLERPGYRIKRRRFQQRKIPNRHKITKSEAIEFMRKRFNVKFEEHQ